MMNTDRCWYKEVCTNECSGSCIRFLEMSYLMDNSNIPVPLQTPKKLSPENCDVEAFKTLASIKADVVSFIAAGSSIYLCSKTTGNGKTSWAVKLLLKYFDEVWPGNGFTTRGLFIHVPTFLLKCKDFGNRDEKFEQLKKDLLTADLVVWDDIASTDVSAYDYNQLLTYLDSRYTSNLSNIYTGNLVTKEELQKSLGIKLTSRILSSHTQHIVLKGGDRR